MENGEFGLGIMCEIGTKIGTLQCHFECHLQYHGVGPMVVCCLNYGQMLTYYGVGRGCFEWGSEYIMLYR